MSMAGGFYTFPPAAARADRGDAPFRAVPSPAPRHPAPRLRGGASVSGLGSRPAPGFRNPLFANEGSLAGARTRVNCK